MSFGEKIKELSEIIKKTEKFFIFLFYVFILFIFIVLFIDFIVSVNTKNKIYYSIYHIPENRVGLVLGTSKYVSKKKFNSYYRYRIKAATELYKYGKIEFIIVSGNGRSKNKRYNEPFLMKKDLIKNGIPSEKIYLDYAGFRTLDSIVRAKKIFGLKRMTIISQKFHIERAIFIAKKKGIEAIGFAAKDVELKKGIKVFIREKLARVKMMFDLLINKKPKILGKKIEIK